MVLALQHMACNLARLAIKLLEMATAFAPWCTRLFIWVGQLSSHIASKHIAKRQAECDSHESLCISCLSTACSARRWLHNWSAVLTIILKSKTHFVNPSGGRGSSEVNHQQAGS